MTFFPNWILDRCLKRGGQRRSRHGRKKGIAARKSALRGVERCEDRRLLTFHLWKIDQVFSSADGKVQFIELHDPANGESHTAGHFISSNENTFTFPADLPTDSTAGKHFLIGTVDYAKQPGAVAPDYTVPDNFFNPSGDSFDYADVDSFSFSAGQVPTDGVNSLFRDVNTGALSTGPNSETDLVPGTTGSISVAVHVNLPPTIDAISDPAPILPNSPQQTINLSGISAGAGETESLTVTATSDDTALIPNPTVNYASPNATGTLSYMPVAGAQGTATITVTVHDDGGTANGGVDTTKVSFKVRVAPPNQPPTIDPINDPSAVLEDSTTPTVVQLSGITGGAGENENLTVSAASSNTELVANPTVAYTSPNARGTLSFVPIAGAFGSATITVTVRDDGGTANGGVDTTTRTFHVTVTQVNDAPTIDAIPDPPPILLNSPPQTVNLTGITAGLNETQNLTVSAASNNTALIGNPTVIYTSPNSTAMLTYTPVAGAKGTATITVTVHDDGGTANGGVDTTTRTFTVHVGVTAAQLYVQHLYQDLLDRAPGGDELAFWTGKLAAGASNGDVAMSLIGSGEHEQLFVNSLYNGLLGRTADSAGLSFFSTQLSANGDEAATIAAIAATDEFFHQAGGSNGGFVDALYQRVLGRVGDAAGMAYWRSLLAAGATRHDVAMGFVISPEFHGLQVNDPSSRFAAEQGWYQTYLHRDGDTLGTSFFVGQLEAGQTAQTVQLELLATAEYVNRAD
jgi:hypothetical protein